MRETVGASGDWQASTEGTTLERFEAAQPQIATAWCFGRSRWLSLTDNSPQLGVGARSIDSWPISCFEVGSGESRIRKNAMFQPLMSRDFWRSSLRLRALRSFVVSAAVLERPLNCTYFLET